MSVFTAQTMARLLPAAMILLSCLPLPAQSWTAALARMPLPRPVTLLTRSNCVAVCLEAFAPDPAVKALVFLPGATDELYFFRHVKAALTNANPTLLDVVQALTRQSEIRASFQPPLLLIHTSEDTLKADLRVEHPATFERLQRTAYLPHVSYDDRNWDDIYPHLRKLKVSLYPPRKHYGSRHFFRPSMAAWNLTGEEAVRAIALASKTAVTFERNRLVFTPDTRKEQPSRIEVLPPGSKPAIRALD